MTSASPPRRVCLGAIVAAHGVRGEVKIATYTERPEAIAEYGALLDESGEPRFRLLAARPARGGVVAKLADVADRTAADALRGQRLYVDRAALPPLAPGEFYRDDLVGMAALSEPGQSLGTVTAVHNFGAGDVLEIEPAGRGPTFLVPFTREAVPDIDVAKGRLVVSERGLVLAGHDERTPA